MPPPSWKLQIPVLCPCGTRRECTIFYTNAAIALHIRTKKHTEWLAEINNNKTNHYAENIELRKTVRSQQVIIAKMEADQRTKIMTIDLLTEQIRRILNSADSMEVDDLLEM